MNRKVFIIVLMLITAVSGAPAGPYRIGVYNNPPKISVGEDGKPGGIFITVVEEIAALENWTVNYIPGSWQENLNRLASGEIDMMVDVAYTPARRDHFRFNKVNVLDIWAEVYVNRSSRIDGFSDLDGVRLATMKGATFETDFPEMMSSMNLTVEMVPVVDYFEAFQLVRDGDCDAAVVNALFGREYGDDFDLERSSMIFMTFPARFAFSQSVPGETVETIDFHLKRMRSDPLSVLNHEIRVLMGTIREFQIPRFVLWTFVVILTGLVVSGLFLLTLRRAVKEKTREISEKLALNQKTKKELELALQKVGESERVKNNFILNLSHEIRTPLNIVLGFSELLTQHSGEIPPGQQEEYIQSMRQNGVRLVNSMDDLLELSALVSSNETIKAEPVDLTTLTESVVSGFVSAAGSKGIALNFEHGREPVLFKTRGPYVEKILDKLLDNAVKYTESGSIRVRLESGIEKPPILSIKDTGVGMSKEFLNMVFTPFSQESFGIGRKFEGLGLSLALARLYAERSNILLTAESKIKTGSIFRLEFRAIPD